MEEINDELNKYLAIVENYPNLKANSQYIRLQNELRVVEDQLGVSRHIYNDVVTSYNTTIEINHNNIVANFFAFK